MIDATSGICDVLHCNKYTNKIIKNRQDLQSSEKKRTKYQVNGEWIRIRVLHTPILT